MTVLPRKDASLSANGGGPEPAMLVSRMADAARLWLASLTHSQQQAVLWPFEAAERGNWHYAPRRRHGLALKDMDAGQCQAAYALLASALSLRGNDKARAIMALEAVLGELERGRITGPVRDPLNYAFTVFGRPPEFPWGWRVEGHHLIVNATVAGPEAVTITPTFWGTNPARIPHGPRAGERVIHREYHLGLELAQSLAPEQRARAVIADRSIGNIIAERGRAHALRVPAGLAFAGLDEGQRQLLMALVGEHVGNAADALGRPYLERLRRDGLDTIHLAWAGGMVEGQAFYYRIHGPRLLIELDCTQNDANHIHSLWRDPTNDWGRDILGEHYRHHHDDD
jgi:hypothetical protein